MAFNINETRTLLGVIERAYPPNPVLVKTFFPNAVTFPTSVLDVDYQKGGRRLAPFVVPGSKGVNMARDGYTTKSYKPPLMRPKRNLSADDLAKRTAGESVVSTRTPEQRAQEYRARDLVDLTNMCVRREEFMAAQLLINGQYDVEGYADDGKLQLVDTINFGFTQKTTLAGNDQWTNANADAYGNIEDASMTIRKNAGVVPTAMFMSAATAKTLLSNKSVYDKLLVPSRDNLALMSIKPVVESPEVTRFGRLEAMNLDMFTYDGIYVSDAGVATQFLPDGYVIIGVPGKGRRLYGAVTQKENDHEFHTYEGRYIPKVTDDIESDTESVIVSSRCLVVPENIDDWYVYKAF